MSETLKIYRKGRTQTKASQLNICKKTDLVYKKILFLYLILIKDVEIKFKYFALYQQSKCLVIWKEFLKHIMP